MISNFDIKREHEDSDIVSHISGQIQSVYSDGCPITSSNIEEIAKAVASFVNDKCDCSIVSSRSLAIFASKALEALGERNVAKRLIIFETGLIMPSEWEVSGQDNMWIIDLKQMTVSDTEHIELIFFKGLISIIECIADLWDNSGGRGTLGLRNVCSSAEAFSSAADSGNKRNKMVREIVSLCSEKLKLISAQKGWEYCPRVMNLDIN